MSPEEKRRKATEKMRQWRAEHPGVDAERARLWRAANPDKVKEIKRRFHASHPGLAAEERRVYREAHRVEEAIYREETRAQNNERQRQRYYANLDVARARNRVVQNTRYSQHAEELKQRSREWRAANPEKLAEQQRRYREENPEKVRAKLARYREENPEKAREHLHKRRARKLGAVGSVSAEEWLEIMAFYGGRCFSCGKKPGKGKKLTRGHIIPLSRGGSNTRENVAPQCAFCNGSQHDRLYPSEWCPSGRPLDLFSRGQTNDQAKGSG